MACFLESIGALNFFMIKPNLSFIIMSALLGSALLGIKASVPVEKKATTSISPNTNRVTCLFKSTYSTLNYPGFFKPKAHFKVSPSYGEHWPCSLAL